jgi:hypothetical protein
VQLCESCNATLRIPHCPLWCHPSLQLPFNNLFALLHARGPAGLGQPRPLTFPRTVSGVLASFCWKVALGCCALTNSEGQSNFYGNCPKETILRIVNVRRRLHRPSWVVSTMTGPSGLQLIAISGCGAMRLKSLPRFSRPSRSQPRTFYYIYIKLDQCREERVRLRDVLWRHSFSHIRRVVGLTTQLWRHGMRPRGSWL